MQRKYAKPTEYDANYNILNSSGSRTPMIIQNIQRERQTNYLITIIEIKNENEEVKRK